MPLHPNQHAYQSQKSIETIFRQRVVQVEKALDRQETALGIFLYIEESCNYTSLTSCVMLLSDVGMATPLSGALGLPWRAAWPRRHLVILSGGLRCPGDALMKACFAIAVVPRC